MADREDTIRELVKYILANEEDHYLSGLDAEDKLVGLDQEFIENNLAKYNHIYMYARIVNAAYEQK